MLSKNPKNFKTNGIRSNSLSRGSKPLGHESEHDNFLRCSSKCLHVNFLKKFKNVFDLGITYIGVFGFREVDYYYKNVMVINWGSKGQFC